MGYFKITCSYKKKFGIYNMLLPNFHMHTYTQIFIHVFTHYPRNNWFSLASDSSCSRALRSPLLFWPWSNWCVVALTVFEDVQLWLLARLYQQFEQLSIAQKGSGANCGSSARGRDVGGLGTLDDAVQRLTKITTVHGTQQTLVKVVGQHFSITIAVQLASNVDTKCIFYFVM